MSDLPVSTRRMARDDVNGKDGPMASVCERSHGSEARGSAVCGTVVLREPGIEHRQRSQGFNQLAEACSPRNTRGVDASDPDTRCLEILI